jgi:large conductance mechanosensitive channel
MKFKLVQEFKEFAVKGNMMDIAIGVIIGTAFNKVVNTLVKEVLMPPLSFMTQGNNWENKKIVLREAIIAENKPKIEEIAIGYGKLIEAGVDFLVIAITVFLVVKVMNAMKQKAEDPKNVTVVTPKNIELMNKTNELLEQQNRYLKSVLEAKN